MKIFWDDSDRISSLIDSWKWRTKNFNISPRDRMISFYATLYTNNRFVENIPDILEADTRHLVFNKIGINSKKLNMYIDRINDFKPIWMNIQPSIFILLSKEIDRRNASFPQSLRYIEFTGEYINQSNINYFAHKYNITISNFYGCNETNYIACQCNCGNMHILENNVFVEILNKNNEPVADNVVGDIVVTSLHNKAMPIVRYKTGDLGVKLEKHNCACGCSSPILKLSGERNSYKIITKNAEYSSYEIIYAIEKVNEYMNNCILQYYAVQETMNDMIIYIVLKDRYSGWKQSVEKVFLECINVDEIRNLNWSFIFKDKILPDIKTGKLNYFKCKVEK